MQTATLEEVRRRNYEIAEAIAPTWERRRAEVEEVSTPVREWMVRELSPREGDTVLELAAARRRGAELGVTNVDYRVIDAERIELDDDSVDGVLCRFGYMLMPDAARALAETRRVLHPGGRLALAVWGAPERNPFFATIAISLVQRGHLPPPEPPPATGPFGMASAERTERLLRAAGFSDVRIEEVAGRFELPDVDEYLSVIADTAGPIALALR